MYILNWDHGRTSTAKQIPTPYQKLGTQIMSPLRLNYFKDCIKYVLYHTSNQENQYQECMVGQELVRIGFSMN